MEKFCFEEEQPRVTVSAVGNVLLLVNGREKIQIVGGIPDENGVATTEAIERKVWEYDGVWLATGGITTEAALTAAVQKMVQEKITEWDTSSAVNGFILNGDRVWLDKATRVGLMNSTSIAKAMGQPTTTLWLSDAKLVVECDKAILLLSALEMYALECFNVTAAHKKAVSEMSTVEEVLGYDYTAGYPEVLTMRV
ncbi:DUF4376 domain-containing protein [uncultured Prevotella sp.]|jgi:hypothetical protein|uniref:DUF4376 domain-containing protein n=1 Tax=uncultured Prevotella sp. TaxID=159272 RepID=UPI0025F9A6C7|nr:DUF4376 domain-containing protein [uncultured Prevotella sp.]